MLTSFYFIRGGCHPPQRFDSRQILATAITVAKARSLEEKYIKRSSFIGCSFAVHEYTHVLELGKASGVGCRIVSNVGKQNVEAGKNSLYNDYFPRKGDVVHFLDRYEMVFLFVVGHICRDLVL